MLYYDYWPTCCRPKVAGYIIPVYINVFAVFIVAASIYALCLDEDCYRVSEGQK